MRLYICVTLMGLCSSFMLPRNGMRRKKMVDTPSNLRLLASRNGDSNGAVSRIWTMSDLYKNIEDKRVSLAVFSEDKDNNKVSVLDTDGTEHDVNLLQADLPTLVDLFRKNGVRFAVKSHGSNGLSGFLSGVGNVFIPFALLSLIFFSFRNGGMNGPGSLGGLTGLQNVGNLNLESNTGVSFGDVAGCDESKLELMEIVDFLKYPQNFTDIGAVSPRCVLLEGPPGTGYTL